MLILDAWWCHLDKGFREWLASKYPWILLLFVPKACTPVAQPMDLGAIAKIKGLLRKMYGKWVIELVRGQLGRGVAASAIQVPADVPTLKKQLLEWLSQGVERLRQDPEGLVHCWASTTLLCAWERATQMEAVRRVAELFPDAPDAPADAQVEIIVEEDAEAGTMGLALMEGAGEEEWQEMVDWAAVETATGQGSSSGA